MTITISFMTANYVAEQLNFNMTRGWGQGDKAANEYYQPIATFEERFDGLLAKVKSMGFDAIDIWTSHLNPIWVTREHVETAIRLLAKHGLTVTSLGGWFGANADEFVKTCELAVSLGRPVLGGSTSMIEKNHALVVEKLKEYGLKLGLENHPEKTPQEMLRKIGDGAGGVIGTTVDTGWYGTQGYDAARAIRELGSFVMQVHLKDVREVGEHNTCALGSGVVPIRECVNALKELGYKGDISIEHEPEHYDPTDEARAGLPWVKEMLAEPASTSRGMR